MKRDKIIIGSRGSKLALIYAKKVKKEIIKIDNKSNKITSDICANIKKCDIDSITSYLIKISNEKDFPDITLKE